MAPLKPSWRKTLANYARDNKHRGSSKRRVTHCGRSSTHSRKGCRVREFQCRKCQNKGHFSVVWCTGDPVGLKEVRGNQNDIDSEEHVLLGEIGGQSCGMKRLHLMMKMSFSNLAQRQTLCSFLRVCVTPEEMGETGHSCRRGRFYRGMPSCV